VIADGPSPGHWKGLAGLIGATRDWLRAWEEYRIEAEEFRELDDARVLVLSRRTGRGKTSGLELGQMRMEGAGLFQFRDGKVTRFVAYLDREHALQAVGLSE
jgi:ketosteroid isomerase-like protein